MALLTWSVSVDEELASRVREHVGDQELSGFVARAVEHELERELLDGYLRKLDDKYGLVPEKLIEHYDALWPS